MKRLYKNIKEYMGKGTITVIFMFHYLLVGKSHCSIRPFLAIFPINKKLDFMLDSSSVIVSVK